MAGNCENWRAVIEPLARAHTVIAPDLPGHGDSAPGGGDYSLGSLATGLRDLLLTLGHERATLVGHSLGGGVAMQFTYQFPEMVERLVLVSSGGLGPDVSPVLRAAALPGADLFISATAGIGAAGRLARSAAALAPSACAPAPTSPRSPAATPRSPDPERRKAFLATLRSVVGTERPARRRPRPPLPGRGAAAPDRLGRPRPDHPRRATAKTPTSALPGSRLEIFEGVGHLPQLEAPGRFIAVLERFLDGDRAGAVRPRRVARPLQDRLSRHRQLRARQDSNLWPPPPEGGALSS